MTTQMIEITPEMAAVPDVAETKPEIEDVVGSLTGFDEIAIEQKFKADLSALNPTMTMRAVAFVLIRREGKDDKEAYGEVMRRTLLDVKAMFRVTKDDEDDEGKG